jgi:hydroxyethylthiazole kinase-like sugar kinase family protein
MDMVTITRAQYERELLEVKVAALRGAAGEMRRILTSGQTLGCPSDEWLHNLADRMETRS